MNRKIAFGFWLMAFGFLPAAAQRVLSLDSCRQMALRNNKQLSISKMKQDVAANERKSARTKEVRAFKCGYRFSITDTGSDSREVGWTSDGAKRSWTGCC